MHESFIDLDELIVLCRDKLAKKFIQEAVACYRAGAYRSCIVAIWNAVVFDFLHKLRELELLGDNEAIGLLQKFEKLSSEKRVKELWQFEANIPNDALTKFELISPLEKSDIERLFEDRSRCAHPSMTSLEEPFEATAELARYHLRSAVTHLLQRPPVQGRAACEKIFQCIKSEYFPVEPELAIKYLQKSPLARARSSLIKAVVIGLTKSLLIEEFPEDERLRQFSALNAISSIYPKETREILDDELSKIILNRVVDANWDKVIIYLGSVTAWDNLSEPCRLNAIVFIRKLDIFESYLSSYKRLSRQNINILLRATRINFLREVVIEKLQISLKDLLSLKDLCKDKVLDEIISPLLRDKIPQANLNELVSMRSEENELLSQKIEPCLIEKIEESSLSSLFVLRSRSRDEFINGLIDPRLQEKISAATLDELLTVRSRYAVFLDEDEEPGELDNLLKLAEFSVVERIKEVPFEDLLSIKSKYSDELFDSLVQPILRENVMEIVDRFIRSGSFDRAASNASLLVEVADSLSPVQWEYVLKAFCENNQVYGSYHCSSIFRSLLKKSVEVSGSLQPYWLSFREKLDKLSNTDIDSLKLLIDSYQGVE